MRRGRWSIVMTTRALTIAGLVTAASLAPAHAAEESDAARVLVIYGEDACPKGDGDEIIVCARKPESERYRIPKDLRRKKEVVGGPGWGSQVANIEASGRQLLPNSCSVIGTNGFTGCTQAMIAQWFAERRMQGQARVAP